jgi:hypothetical protein
MKAITVFDGQFAIIQFHIVGAADPL